MEKVNRKAILQQHNHPITKYSDGRWKTYVDVVEDGKQKRKQIAKNTKKEVEDAVVSHLIETSEAALNRNKTFTECFDVWMLWRRDCGTDPKTMKCNKDDFDRFVKPRKLASKKIASISVTDLEDFFYQITINHSITHKRFINIKGVINQIFRYCVREKMVDCNPMDKLDLDLYKNRFKVVNTNKKPVYTEDERNRILSYLEDKNDPYSLAISLAFCLCVRIGELTALKKTDVIGGCLMIHRSQRDFQTMNDDMTFNPIEHSYEERVKGNRDSGFRSIPLSTTALNIIERINKNTPAEQEYMFVNVLGCPILGRTFNKRLKGVCCELGIDYKSSHQIRFSIATKLCEAGVPINQLSVLLGHSETKTTLHYIRQRQADERTVEIINAVL